MKRNLGTSLAVLALGIVTACRPGTGATVREAVGSGNPVGLVSPLTDDSFSGFWLDIERTMATLGVSRYQAHEIQNFMRDELEERAGGFSPLTQQPHLESVLRNAIERVVERRESESGVRPMTFAPGEFVLALDLDETLIGHWYEDGEHAGSFVSEPRDVVPNTIEKATGNSVTPTVLYSPLHVQVRPGVEAFMAGVARLAGFRGFVVYSAKDDRAAVGLVKAWREFQPAVWTNVIAVLTRNHLRYDAGLPKPSKDLRIFDEALEHVFLIDDNETRVMQKPLNYMIPKFNADAYLRSLAAGGDVKVKELNDGLLPYLTQTLTACVASSRGAPSPTPCFRETLGFDTPTPTQELERYLAHMQTTRDLAMTVDGAKAAKLFEAGFFPGKTVPTSETFPAFKAGKIVNGAAILPP